MLRNLNLRLTEVDACEDGYVDCDKLTALFRRKAVKAFVTLANVNNPLGKTIPDEVKAEITRQADENGVIIIEDDTFGDAAFGGQRPFPMRAFSHNVILCSGFSKTIAPACVSAGFTVSITCAKSPPSNTPPRWALRYCRRQLSANC